MEQDDILEPTFNISQQEVKGLVNKGLIKCIGHDPLGRPVYVNTQLGDLVANELDKLEEE